VATTKSSQLLRGTGRSSIVALAVRRALRPQTAFAIGALGVFGAFGPVTAAGAADSAETSATPNSSQLSEIVVTAQRAALISAQKIKQNATEVVDSIVADDIGKLPDRSVTEALQRIVGVTIDHTMARGDPEHFSVEGSGVNIRGLTYVRSELNGRDSFSANGGRALSFEDVPPELLAGADVYKNPSAEQIEGAIAGLVNLRTTLPFDFKGPRASFSLQGTWGDLQKGKPTPSESVLLSDRWQTALGEIGFLVDFARSESKTRTDGVQQEPFYPRTDLVPGTTVWVPKGVSWRTLQFDRKREGDYAALQWRPNDDIESSLTYFRSHYKMHWDEQAIFTQASDYNIVPLAGTQFTYDKNGVFQSGTETDPADKGLPFDDDVRSADRVATTSDVSWRLKWQVNDRLTLKSDLQYVHATTDYFDSTVATGVNIPSETITRSGGIPTVQVDQSYMTNPSNYYWAFTMDHKDESVGRELAWAGSGEYKISDGFFKSFRAGARISRRNAETNNAPYNWQAISQTWMLGWYEPTLAYLNKFNGPYQTYAFPNFFNGAVKLPSPVVFPAVSLALGWPSTYQQLQSYRQTLCAQLNPTCVYTWSPVAYSAATLNEQRELTSAGFGSLRFGLDDLKFPIDGDVGVRIVGTNDTATGSTSINAFTPAGTLPAGNFASFAASSTPINAKNNFTDVLPTFNMRMKFTPNLQARLAVAKAIARPDFSQLQAYTSTTSSIDTGTLVQSFNGTANGNPNLRPTKSTQIDGTLEWYFAPSSSLTGAIFYKDLSDIIINDLFNVPAKDTAGVTHNFLTTGPVNGAKGKAQGFEIAYQQYFDFLPNALKGLGLQANFTYVDSKQTLNKPFNAAYCSGSTNDPTNLGVNLNGCDTDARTFGNPPLANLSKDTYNLIVLYDRGPVSGRLAYNWRSRYLQAINVNPTQGADATNTNPASSTFGAKTLAWGLPIWADNYGQLDGSVFYTVLEGKLTFGLEAQNLTDATYKQLMEQHIGMEGRAWFKTGRRYTLQMRMNFGS
jgi:iron complex outermembrane recepter protein